MNVYHKSLLFPRKSLSLSFFFKRKRLFPEVPYQTFPYFLIELSRVLDPDQSLATGITTELIENDSLGFLTYG